MLMESGICSETTIYGIKTTGCRTVDQENAPINNASDLNDQIRKAVRAMTNEALLEKGCQRHKKGRETKHEYRPPPLATLVVVVVGGCVWGGVATRRPGRWPLSRSGPVTETEGDATPPRPVAVAARH